VDVVSLEENCYTAINDDLNSPIAIAHLFDGVRMINSINDGTATISDNDLSKLKSIYNVFVFEILGLKNEAHTNGKSDDLLKKVVDLVLQLRMEAKNNKDWASSDRIRNELTQIGIQVKDRKEGFEWETI
jgi:cysteinyl-tRNA synthetase